MIYVVYGNISVGYLNLKYRYNIRKTKQKIEVAKIRAGKLKAKLSNVSTDGHIEEIARTKLGLVKKGEVAYQIVEK